MEKTINKDWTAQMSSLKIGERKEGIPSEYYSSLCTTRTRLKLKPEFHNAHWSLKVGKGFVTIKRTR